MTRGGKREKAGRPSTWKSGCKFKDTKLIRVPAAISDKLLEIAHKLDANESIEFVTKSKSEIEQQIMPYKTATLALSVKDIACPRCGSTQLSKDGLRNGEQKYACRNCKRKFLERLAARTSDSVTNSNN